MKNNTIKRYNHEKVRGRSNYLSHLKYAKQVSVKSMSQVKTTRRNEQIVEDIKFLLLAPEFYNKRLPTSQSENFRQAVRYTKQIKISYNLQIH